MRAAPWADARRIEKTRRDSRGAPLGAVKTQPDPMAFVPTTDAESGRTCVLMVLPLILWPRFGGCQSHCDVMDSAVLDGIAPPPLARHLDAVRPRLGLRRRVPDDGLREHRRAHSGGDRHPPRGVLGGAGTIQCLRDRDRRHGWIVDRIRRQLLDRLETRPPAGGALRAIRPAIAEENRRR